MGTGKLLRAISLLLVTLSLSANALAADNGRNLAVARAGNSGSDKRIALVIGNGAYANSPLKNPVNDARDVANKLRGLGFDVIERNNLQTRQIGATLREFRSKLVPGAVALVFYAGHGLQIKGDNYLPAVDADINSEEDVPNQSLAIKQIMDMLDESKTRLNLVFLDACRNNPYARSFRSADKGLARVSAPSGTLISYATRPGSVAADGGGRNGLYTGKLLAQMDSNLQIEQALKRVVTEVKAASQGKQEPWMEGSIEGDFCFTGCAASGSGTQVAGPGPARARTKEEIEDDYWEEIRNSGDQNSYVQYRKAYPEGRYLHIADLKIAQAQSGSTAPNVEQSRLLEADLAGKWKFGRSAGTFLAPAGHLCDVELLLTKGAFGNVIRACDSNESFWRLNADKLEFVGSAGGITTVFSRNEQGYWEGAFVGMGDMFSGVIHYLKRNFTKRHDGVWSGELETYGGLFNSPVKVNLEVAVSDGQISGNVFMYGENRTLSGRVDKNGDLVNAKLVGFLQGYALHGKLWEADGEGAMGWKLRFKLTRKPALSPNF